jgi:transposase
MKNMDKRVVSKGLGILVFIVLIAFLLIYLVRKKSNNKENDLTSAKALATIVAKKLIEDEFLGEVEIKGILYSPSKKTFNKKGKIQSAFLGTVAIRINNSVCLVTETNGEKETGTIQELSVKEWNSTKGEYTWY